MLENAFIETLGTFLAFAFLFSVVWVLKWVSKKILPKKGMEKKCVKYKIGDEVEVITKDGASVKGIITKIGDKSYNVKFEKPISFNNGFCKVDHPLCDAEINSINNKILKADRIL